MRTTNGSNKMSSWFHRLMIGDKAEKIDRKKIGLKYFLFAASCSFLNWRRTWQKVKAGSALHLKSQSFSKGNVLRSTKRTTRLIDPKKFPVHGYIMISLSISPRVVDEKSLPDPAKPSLTATETRARHFLFAVTILIRFLEVEPMLRAMMKFLRDSSFVSMPGSFWTVYRNGVAKGEVKK